MKELHINASITTRNETVAQYLSDINRYPILSVDEEVELARRKQQGDAWAKDRLVCCNLRFVVSVAKQYQHQGLTLGDLINEGNMGLMKAVERFDDTLGFKFISYAVWWIRQSIICAISDKGNLVRLPQSAAALNNRINKSMQQFVHRHQRQPNAEELAEMLEMEESKVAAALTTGCHEVSADAPMGDDGDTTMAEQLTDAGSAPTDAALDRESCQTDVTRVLQCLDERGRNVIVRLYGIGCPEQSADEVALSMGLSCERVRQIREGAIRSLALNPCVGQLRKYIC